MSASDLAVVALAVSVVSIFGLVLAYESWQESRANKKGGQPH
jgi:hypothetical protein